ncbi:hypothetical protein RhiirA5_422750 [Rhizophagus irregularis]|uniref:Uncharacterized protein n=1 Tax=Rhizophagus irregularis TaxID=588596 RepID=A0A2I1F0N3_9GLOM|nr:hypothetical protein RhiirA5_422750 [Rhizophagus irregularis]PKC62745.1 hypothetical protein RhiirA1_464723 [Rhizophagus irregularis]PKY27927.1 hypothetical protein RhiirB3_443841 [Rhizophagus irregularis]CAG8556532.1 6683_t:CDS:2 [Rhizophagus irregularis]
MSTTNKNISSPSSDDSEIIEVSENETNRARLIALVVREAVFVGNQQDWNAAIRMILQHKLLTLPEKNTIVALLQIKSSCKIIFFFESPILDFITKYK